MKSLRELIEESCTENCGGAPKKKIKKPVKEVDLTKDGTCEDGTCEGETCEDETCKEEEELGHRIEEGEVKSEKDFKEYAENKFKEVFGDKLDKERMNFTINGLLKDNKSLVDKGEWGELVGMLNKSFGHK